MKKQLLLLLMILLPMVASAHDIEVKNADGVTIYYNYVNDGTELAVTYPYPGNSSDSYNKYSGNVVIPEEVTYMNRTLKVTSIGERAFYVCSGLTSVTIGNSVTTIGNYAFDGCTGLTSITIPNSVTSIGNAAFFCSGLTSVTIPNSVTSIGNGAFEGCFQLASVHISSIEAWCNISFSNSYANPLCYAYHLYLVEEEIKDLVIPNSVTSIGDYAFYGCRGLTSVTIGNGVTSIGSRAFDGVDYSAIISLIENPFNIVGKSSDNRTFSQNTFIVATLYVPKGTTNKYKATDGWKNFSSIKEGTGGGETPTDPVEINGIYYNLITEGNNTEVTSNPQLYSYSGDIVIPPSISYQGSDYSVTSIGENAFLGCSGLTSITIPNSVTSIGERAFYLCSGLTSVTIGNSVTSIGDAAFRGCRKLTSVTIPNSVTSIGNQAFSGCSGLTSITIPNSVTSIGDAAFSNCRKLTSVTIPNSVTSIGGGTFFYCSGLTSVTIGNSVTSIGNQAFDYCTGLTSITIPNSVTSIGDAAFRGCSGLTSVTIPNSVTSIGNQAFSGCSGLTSVTIPNSVTSIGNQAFSGCSGLTSITIPNSVTSIGSRAFDGVDYTTIISLIENPFNIVGKYSNSRTFSQNTFNNATLYVPKGTIDKYKATEGWKDFLFIEEGNPTGIKVIENTKNNNAIIYDLNGVRLSEPMKGINIINGKKIIVK